MRIALLQATPTGSPEGNLEKGLELCRQAAGMDADIALFPEMWSYGYDIASRPPELWNEGAVTLEEPYVEAFAQCASALGMAIATTLLEKTEAGLRNTLILLDRSGRNVLTYAKVHTCDFAAERHLVPGDGFSTAMLETEDGPVCIGAMICYDREFPEAARVLMLSGAEIILVPNACPMDINRLAQLRARAFENMLAIATCNYPVTVDGCNGHSSVFDGIAYHPDGDARDTCILEADGDEGVFVADLDLSALREYRRREVHGNAYRHPDKYMKIVERNIEKPFIRADYRP